MKSFKLPLILGILCLAHFCTGKSSSSSSSSESSSSSSEERIDNRDVTGNNYFSKWIPSFIMAFFNLDDTCNASYCQTKCQISRLCGTCKEDGCKCSGCSLRQVYDTEDPRLSMIRRNVQQISHELAQYSAGVVPNYGRKESLKGQFQYLEHVLMEVDAEIQMNGNGLDPKIEELSQKLYQSGREFRQIFGEIAFKQNQKLSNRLSQATESEIELDGSWVFSPEFIFQNADNPQAKNVYANFTIDSHVDFAQLTQAVKDKVGSDIKIISVNLGGDQDLSTLQDVVTQAVTAGFDKDVVGPPQKKMYRVDPMTDLTIWRGIFTAPGLSFYSDQLSTNEQEKVEIKITVKYTLPAPPMLRAGKSCGGDSDCGANETCISSGSPGDARSVCVSNFRNSVSFRGSVRRTFERPIRQL